ncbi:MAG: hypothetical protein AAGI14_08215 [Pseudomonadota bacterium]
MRKSSFRYFKTSLGIIELAMMMYVRFPLSLRNVEDLLQKCGIGICHESVRLRSISSGQLQKFASTHASSHNHFNRDRQINHRATFKFMRNAALTEWHQLLAG